MRRRGAVEAAVAVERAGAAVDARGGAPTAAVEKRAVARNFSAAADRYDGAAAAQDEIAAGLARRLPDGFLPGSIVDLGCGTGLLSARLLARFPRATLLGLDLAPGMIDACRRRFAAEPRACFAVADAELPPAGIGPVDLVAASCSAQWFHDLEEALRRWGRALAPGGLVAAALLVRGSYPELDLAHRAAVGAPFAGLAFPGEGEAEALVRRAGLVPFVAEPATVAVTYRSAREALASFRDLGAVLCGQPGRGALGPGATRRLLAAYEARCRPGPPRVTHRVLHVVARRAP